MASKYPSQQTQYCDKLILAPMVRMGTLPFRLLCLEYGADLVFTEEIVDHKLVKCKRVVNPVLNTIDFVDNGSVAFRTCATEKDRVVLQIGTASAERATRISELVGSDVSGIDVNMGCPKDFSVKGGMGVALLNNPERISEIMRALVKTSQIPVTCKIRILPTVDRTRELLGLIESTGVSAVSIHGRTASQRRTEPNQNNVLTAICSSHVSIPIIANGVSSEVDSLSDIREWNRKIGSDSIMVARAAQRNPSIFRKSGPLSALEMSQRYLTYAIDYDNPYGNTLYCLCNIMHSLMDKEVGREVSSSRSMAELSKALGLSEYYEQTVAKRKTLFNALNSSDHDTLTGAGLVYTDVVNNIPEVSECGVVELHLQYRKRGAGEIEGSSTPKEKVLKWARKIPDLKMTYSTKERSSDRRFKSVLCLGEDCYSSSYWERNKKLAEQAAASVAMQVLGIECDS